MSKPSKPPIVLPVEGLDAVLFDMDGVVTRTATVHADAWKGTFDAFLASRAGVGALFKPFDTDYDYLRYVDGRPRLDGVKGFLESRSINLPLGQPSDGPEDESIWGLANRKEALFSSSLQSHGVEAFESTVEFIKALRRVGLKTGIFSASKHVVQVLSAASLLNLFDARVDGTDAERLGLAGKPDPATLIELGRRLGTDPARSAVVEDAIAGVKAGKAGGFAVVIGVNRVSEEGALLEVGADLEVRDLREIRLSAS